MISMTGSMAEINPLRYRGYFFCSSTGFYYLQSRYYCPNIGRFINADAFLSTGQGHLGFNMFAYCLNNPVNFVDPDGYFAQVIGATAGKVLALERVVRVARTARTVRDADRQLSLWTQQAPLIADARNHVAASGAMVAGKISGSTGARAHADAGLPGIASRPRFGTIGECVAAATAMAGHMKNNKGGFQYAEFQFSGPLGGDNWVISMSSPIFGRGEAISRTGYHRGILVTRTDMIHCNAHPHGLPRNAWFNDFQGHGVQHRHIGPAPIWGRGNFP